MSNQTTIITTRAELREELRELLRLELLAAIIESTTRANPEKLYTRAHAARILGKSKTTIKRMIDQNRLQTTADDKYISQATITAYLNGKKSQLSHF